MLLPISRLTVIAILALSTFALSRGCPARWYHWVITCEITQVKNSYKLADLLQQLANKGFWEVDTEQGQNSPRFRTVTFGSVQQPLDGLAEILTSQNWGYETHGTAIILYDKALRASGKAYPLNLTMSPFTMKGVSLCECFSQIGSQLDINLTGGAGFFTNKPLPPKLDIQLNGGTLREALFQIVDECHAKTWMFHGYSIGTKKYYEVYIQ